MRTLSYRRKRKCVVWGFGERAGDEDGDHIPPRNQRCPTWGREIYARSGAGVHSGPEGNSGSSPIFDWMCRGSIFDWMCRGCSGIDWVR